MERRQNLYYALGILAYAVCMSDGEIQDEEKEKLMSIVKEETDHDIDFQYVDIIFQLLQRDHIGKDRIYEWAIEELKKGRHYLSPEIKQKMTEVLYKIGEAFDHITEEEKEIITRFENDIDDIGSPHFIKGS